MCVHQVLWQAREASSGQCGVKNHSDRIEDKLPFDADFYLAFASIELPGIDAAEIELGGVSRYSRG